MPSAPGFFVFVRQGWTALSIISTPPILRERAAVKVRRVEVLALQIAAGAIYTGV